MITLDSRIMEKLAKHRISRNRILLYRTKIRLFYIAAHCFVFIFRHGFFVGIVSQRAHEDAHLFRLYFFSCHVLGDCQNCNNIYTLFI